MEVEEYINKMINIQNNILDYMNDVDNDNFMFENLYQSIDDLKVLEDSLTLKSLLILIHKITYNHHFNTNQIPKIQKIFKYLQNSINHMISNKELYHIFENNIRMLIILIEEKILNNDENYFQISDFYLNPKNIIKDKNKSTQNNEEKITLQFKLLNNHNYLYQLIENDSIKEFIIYVNQTNLSLNSTHIKISTYEKNIFLRNKSPTLIELASFYGSIQIFQYLRFNNVELTPSIWIYTIHSQNAELIHLLEEINIDPPKKSFFNCYLEAIECHHNSIAEYIHNNYLLNEKIDTNSKDYIEKVMKSHNYNYIPSILKNKCIPYYLCQYNYSKLVKISLETKFFELKTYMYRIPFLFFLFNFIIFFLL